MEFSIDREKTTIYKIATFIVLEHGKTVMTKCIELDQVYHLPVELFDGQKFKPGDIIHGVEVWHTDYGGGQTFLCKDFRKAGNDQL